MAALKEAEQLKTAAQSEARHRQMNTRPPPCASSPPATLAARLPAALSTPACHPPPRRRSSSRSPRTRAAGNVAFNAGQLTEAVACYSRAIEFHKGGKAAYANRAAAHLKLRNFLAALDDCSRTLEIATYLDEDIERRPPPPPVLKAHVRRAAALSELGRFDALVVVVVSVLTVYTNIAYSVIGGLLLAHGRAFLAERGWLGSSGGAGLAAAELMSHDFFIHSRSDGRASGVAAASAPTAPTTRVSDAGISVPKTAA